MNAVKQHSKNQTIAMNALALFARMFIVTIINLYAVRLILHGLGDMDYGIFNTIASIITISACISSTLSLAIQRFYSVALGHNSPQEFNKVFSLSINIVVGISLLVFLLFETVGLWFVNTKLVIPLDRMEAANYIYQISLFVLILSFLQIPYTAAIFANEAMGTYALISLAECLLKLLVAGMLAYCTVDHLVFYSSGLLAVAVIVFILYALIARYKYQGCRYHSVSDSGMYRQLLSFSGWTLFGAIANVGLIQGSSILLNIFFGPIIVASYAIAQQINAAFNALTNSMILSFRPPMIKAHTENDTTYLKQLFVSCNKFVVYILAAVSIPLFLEMDIILRFWLNDVSSTTILFARLVIIYVVFAALHYPITIIMQALGRLREYHLPVESVCLFSVPLTWLFFSMGCAPHYVFVSTVSLCIIAHGVRVWCVHRYYPLFSVRQYVFNIMLPAFSIVAFCALVAWMLRNSIPSPTTQLLVVGVFSPLILAIIVYTAGLSSEERQLILRLIKKRRGSSL